MLVKLGLKTFKTLKQQIQSKGYYLFLALTRFIKAYGSRFAPLSIVYFISQKRLLKEHCLGFARLTLTKFMA
jgi:hypothetical protein